MKSLHFLTTVLLFSLPLLAAETNKQLATDVRNIAALVAANESAAISNYLYKGVGGLSGGDVLTAAMARNALNKLSSDERALLPVARMMYRHAQGTNFPSDTRQYGFAKLAGLAQRSQEVNLMARSLATEIINRSEDPLKGAAERFLGESQSGPKTSLPGGTSKLESPLVGRWQHKDDAHKLTTTLVFRKDGTYTGNVAVNGKVDGEFSGRWFVKDRILNYAYTSSTSERIPVGAKDQDKLIEVRKDQYTIEDENGRRETYIRLQ